MKKAIVTGANGFIGSAVCNALCSKGVAVIAVVHQNTERIANLEHNKGFRVLHCELENFRGLSKAIPDRDVDVFYHFAWAGSSGSLRGDANIQIDNVKFTCDAVKACAEIKCKRFVFASSVMVYEIEAAMETDYIPGINSLYCSAKLAADYMARAMAGNMGVDYIRTIISNVYGPGEKSSRLVNSSLRKMINGEYCAFSAGEQIYDFIYITDAAEAFVSIGEKGVTNRSYYIGSHSPKPLKEYLTMMRDCVDPSIKIGLGDLPFNGVSLTYQEFDIYAVERDTGFTPRISFYDGINETIEDIRREVNDI